MAFTPKVSAQVEVLILQFNAIVKIMRTKRFKQLQTTNNEFWWERRCIYEDQQFALQAEIERLSADGPVDIWRGILE